MSEPITSHQLFPAVVALWFGALFGLGSLAIRPALLENLVVTSKLDLIVPAAAPPLGMTARMLMALALAAFGAMLGIWIARRLGRTKQQPAVRKRDLRGSHRAADPLPSQRADYDAPAPVSVHDEIGAADELGGVLAGRRRGALAIEPEAVDFVPHDIAPLPGGAPQMIDPTVFSRPDPMAPTDACALHTSAPVQDQADPLDLGHFATPADLAPPAPGLAPASAAGSAPRQIFQPNPVDLPGTVTQPAPLAPQPADMSLQRQIFGMPIADDHVDQQHIRDAGFKTSVFESEAPQPLFVNRTAPAGNALEMPMPDPTPAPRPGTMAAPAEPVSPLVAAGLGLASPPPPAAPAAPVAPEHLPGEQPDKVAMSDLASRLRQSMEQRRAARTARSAAEMVTAPPPSAQTAAEVHPTALAAATPASFAASAEWSATGPAPAAPNPAPPAAFLPVSAATGAEALVAPLTQMPAALRPLDLALHAEEDDDAMLASLIPPRHLSQDDVAAQQNAPAATVPPLADDPEREATDDDDAYASLLDIGSPLGARGQFVRIEDPSDNQAEIEPVVIFPGQATLSAQAALGAAPASDGARRTAFAPAVEATPFRRFDAPSAAGHGGMVAAAASENHTDPTEADQALRAALANLQRISGAA